MKFIAASHYRHAQEIARSMGLNTNRWMPYNMNRLMGMSGPDIIICSCAKLDDHNKAFIASKSSRVIHVDCSDLQSAEARVQDQHVCLDVSSCEHPSHT